jgi:hypothetical protein
LPLLQIGWTSHGNSIQRCASIAQRRQSGIGCAALPCNGPRLDS